MRWIILTEFSPLTGRCRAIACVLARNGGGNTVRDQGRLSICPTFKNCRTEGLEKLAGLTVLVHPQIELQTVLRFPKLRYQQPCALQRLVVEGNFRNQVGAEKMQPGA